MMVVGKIYEMAGKRKTDKGREEKQGEEKRRKTRRREESERHTNT